MRWSRRPPRQGASGIEEESHGGGLVIALAATFAAEWFRNPLYDGVGSICIALVLGITAALLARESKGLLIGEPASLETRRSILRVAERHAKTAGLNALFTVHLAPHQIFVAMTLDFANEVSAAEVEAEVETLEREIRALHPEIHAVFLKPQSVGRTVRAPRSVEAQAPHRSG